MYTRLERKQMLEELSSFFNSIEAIRGAVLLGSGTKGFTDEYSDLDFMLAVNQESDCVVVKELVLTHLIELGYSFGKTVEFNKNRFILVAILENFLELDISIVPVNELIAMSEQWEVLFDKDYTVYTKMSDDWNWWSNIIQNKSIIEQIVEKNTIVETTYLLRRGLIELARNNLIYAANLISEIRSHIIYVECLIEGKKVHQVKNYLNLNPEFIDNLSETFAGNLDRMSILNTYIQCKDLFFQLIKSITNDHEHLKHEEIITNYLKTLF